MVLTEGMMSGRRMEGDQVDKKVLVRSSHKSPGHRRDAGILIPSPLHALKRHTTGKAAMPATAGYVPAHALTLTLFSTEQSINHNKYVSFTFVVGQRFTATANLGKSWSWDSDASGPV
jgi:hypothetical protein